VSKSYVGYTKRLVDKMREDYTIFDVMELFLDFVKNSGDVYMPKEKIKMVIKDFLSEQDIPLFNELAEDETLMLEKWTKAVNGE